MNKIASLAAAALLAVAGTSAVADSKQSNIAAFKAAGYTLVNEDCADEALTVELACWSSGVKVHLVDGELYAHGVTYNALQAANPRLQKYLEMGYLPADHFVATQLPKVEISSLK